jgi:co-chaperonin GroES (HSP10)
MIYKNIPLPDPVGYFILVEMDSQFIDDPEANQLKSKGGIIITNNLAARENYTMCKATVLAMGQDCYSNTFKEKVGSHEPWCTVGDKILITAHSGRNVPAVDDEFVHGRFQLITDQSICGIYRRHSNE